jgi:tetratricopeptide (TPR) repeat protein
MLEKEQHILPVDELFDDKVISDFVKSIQIDSPYQQMLLEGVLTESVRDEKLFVSFTVEGYFHFVLGDVIFEHSIDKDHNYLISLLEGNALNGIKNGVEQCLIKEVNHGKLDRLVAFIDAGGEAESVARFPLVHAFMKNKVEDVFQTLMENPSASDWNVIKHVRGVLLGNQKQHVVDQLDGIIKESDQLKTLINELLKSKNELEFSSALTLISFYSDLNALDQAKTFYNQFIQEAEKRNDKHLLAVALEQLGDSEYKRSGQDGYRAAMDALTRAATIRESETSPQKDKLKNTYRLLGFAYLSLGLQVIKSTEYFEKAKAIMLEESTDSAELAEINLYIGLVNFWRGLRGVGRWGHADPTLLEGLDVDLFEYADSQFQMAYNHNFKHLGKTHPQTFKTLHYLQENRYAMGNYELAIQWLKIYVDALPFKIREHTDNFYQYCLIVSLEESAKRIASSDKAKALTFIHEAISYCKNYDQNNQITQRLLEVKKQIEEEVIIEHQYITIDKLAPLDEEKDFKGVWSKWEFSEQLTGFQTNNWMSNDNGIWFFNGEKKQLIYWSRINNSILEYNPSNWPEGCGKLVFDSNNQKFYAWSSILSTVYELNSPDGTWNRLSHGVHDVHACGASFAFDPINNRLFEFGGYGYFTYKNWLWVYDLNEKKWIQLKENKPGISPYPRNGQILSIDNCRKSILVSGIGSDTGIQREHKPRMGLGSATDVGYFTWLRDAHELDLETMTWKKILSANHESIRHEGAIGVIEKLNLIINWAGIIPSPTFGVEAEKLALLSAWQLTNKEGFKNISFEGDLPPLTEGTFVSISNTNCLLYIHSEGIWKLTINDI